MSEIFHGTPPEPRSISFEQDQKGVAHMTISIPMVFEKTSGGFSFPRPLTYPAIPGWGFVGARGREADGGAWNWEVTFEGAGPLQGAPGGKEKEDQAIYTFEPADAEIPLSSHPDFQKFLKNFAGKEVDGRVIFEMVLPREADAELVTQNKGNPFFGVESYLSFGATWTKSYLIRNGQPPANLLHNVEGVCDIPTPAGFKFPNIGKDRNWLKRMPSIRFRGSSIEVTERYLLSGRGGHNRVIYKAGGL
jgi:hypothetical protein